MAVIAACVIAAETGTPATVAAVCSGSVCLCISRKKAAGEGGTCQNHHHPPSHDILLWNRRNVRLVRRWRARGGQIAEGAMNRKWDTSFLPQLNSRL
jgi:hypothetical protein